MPEELINVTPKQSMQDLMREEFEKVKDLGKTTIPAKGIFIENDDYKATRNAGVSMMYNPITRTNEEKIEVHDKKDPLKKSYIVDVPLGVALRIKGLKFKTIAKYMGVPEKVLVETLIPYLEEDHHLELIDENKEDVLLSIQARLMAGFTPEKIAKATVKDIAMALGIVYDKTRLEQGKSTENKSINLSGMISEIHGERTIKDEEQA